eukprot:maker-scaffold629_size122686-snap-gene-0.27 protein:Tk00809 transcript:maker-scaffold629_size122686-snap-gene-0.27-mRNA-1 annotation:"conserved hypothetical protein"
MSRIGQIAVILGLLGLGVAVVFMWSPLVTSLQPRIWSSIFALQTAMAASSSTITPYSMVFVTAPNKDVAQTLAGGLVSNKLAACVNIIPGISSVYEWEGKIETDSELLLMIKTRTSTIEAVTDFVNQNHPYDTAEVIATSIEHGSQKYLDWIGNIVYTCHKVIARLAHHLPRGEYLRELARGLFMSVVGYGVAAVVPPRLKDWEASPFNAHKAVQVALKDVARTITGKSRQDHVQIADLLHLAGFTLVL